MVKLCDMRCALVGNSQAIIKLNLKNDNLGLMIKTQLISELYTYKKIKEMCEE